jgi:hypothetical protein
MKINEETYGLKAVVNRHRDAVKVVELNQKKSL